MSQFLLLSDTHFGFSTKTSRIWERYWDEVIATSPEFERLDALILAGDVYSHESRQLRSPFKMFRRKMGDKPIFWVRGNHDYWDSNIRNLQYLIEKTDKLATEYNITSLHNGGEIFPDIENDTLTAVVGWDCWYTAHPARYTQCLNRIPQGGWDAHEFLSKRALDGFTHMLDQIEEYKTTYSSAQVKIVVVTHMPGGYTERHIGQPESWFNQAVELADVLCYGHTHRRDDRVEKGCWILNAGSDYNKPNHRFFEVDNRTKPDTILNSVPSTKIILDDNF